LKKITVFNYRLKFPQKHLSYTVFTLFPHQSHTFFEKKLKKKAKTTLKVWGHLQNNDV